MPSLPFEQKREFLIRQEEEPTEFGKPPAERTIEEHLDRGIVNLNKPSGPTSNQISEAVKKILNVKKAGHSGTLDPKVTGVLAIGVGKGTKVMNSLLLAGKEYTTLMHLHEEADEKDIKKVIKEFTTKIFQRPPIHAAVRRLLRIREVYYTEVLEIDKKDVLFKIGCEAGTYIRRFAYDIGMVLGVGAHMQQLIRSKVGSFKLEDSVYLHELIDAYHFWKEDNDETELRRVVRPLEEGLEHLPKIIISDYAINAISHGAQLAVPGILKVETGIERGDIVAVFTQKGEAVMVGTVLMDSDWLSTKSKGLAVKTERVLIDPEAYPRFKA